MKSKYALYRYGIKSIRIFDCRELVSVIVTLIKYCTSSPLDQPTISISTTGWDHPHEGVIGAPTLPPHLNSADIIGASKNTTYLMPAGRLVPKTIAYENATLIAYNDNFFAVKMVTSTPGVPFGKRFLARTQIIVINTGENSCRMICSVEPEFPDGPPLGMGGSIRKGMKTGTIQTFEKMASHITGCAVSYGC